MITSALAGLVALMAVSATPTVAKPPLANGQIAFARFNPLLDDTQLYVVNPDGSHERQVLATPVECPRWSPAGTRITSCGFPPHGATALINPDDGSYRVIPMPDPDALFTGCPLMSPNGRLLACEGFGEADPALNGLYTIRVSDGQGLTRLTSMPGGNDQPGDYSPKGKRLVFGRFDENRDPVGLYVVKSDGTHLRRITPAGFIVTSAGDWSPRGNAIVFSRRVSPGTRNSLWMVHADGSGLRRIDVAGVPACGGLIADPAARGCFNPRWSPDGTKIVFNMFSDATGENVFTANADGTGVRQVTHGDEDEAPDWGTHPVTP
jgi:Tol biopolymer transport system component